MYFLHYQGQNRGPYALDQIQSMWASGIITADAVYWEQADSVWKPIADLLAKESSERANISQPPPLKRQPRAAPAPAVPTASETRKPSIASSGPKGVGGWLWFFC